VLGVIVIAVTVVVGVRRDDGRAVGGRAGARQHRER